MYTCRDAHDRLTDAREGALSGWTAFWHRLHTTICPHCRASIRQYEHTLAITREIPAEEPSERLVDAALSAFRDRSK
jgi:hypothetical protein